MRSASKELQDEVFRIARKHDGVLHPRQLVEDAERDESPLHAWFEWDDTAAADAYRVAQARELIQVCVTVVKVKRQEISVRAMVSLPSDRHDGGYRMLVDVMNDAGRREELLSSALDELKRMEERYKHLTELAPVFEAAKAIRKVS